jgi:hypothetical protein
MNQHLAKAFHDYTNRNINFTNVIDWHFCNGFVLCNPECFGIGYFSDSSEPTNPTKKHHANSLFVTYCAGDMRQVLELFEGQFDFVSFQRGFKGSCSVRLWDYQKTLNRIK